MGGDDGAINVASVLGDFFGPTDWAPDVGHGEIASFRDTNWMEATPPAGTVAPGRTRTVTLRLGGPDVDPGTYEGTLTLVSNDPRRPQIPVAVSLEVALPADFGTVTGVVLDERTSAARCGGGDGSTPFATARPTSPAIPPTPTATICVFVPAGTWPITAGADGYVTSEGEVIVTAGSETTFDVFLASEGPEIVISAEEFLDFELAPDETDTRLLNIASTGTAEIEFEIFERAIVELGEVTAPHA